MAMSCRLCLPIFALLGASLPLGSRAHGRLTVPTPRIGDLSYENDPVSSEVSEDFVCRHPQPNPSVERPVVAAGGRLDMKWDLTALHVGDCAVFISYDVDKPRASQKFVKIANIPDCKSFSEQRVSIDVPSQLPAGSAILRWDWKALHVWPKIEWYVQCADIIMESSSSLPVSSLSSFSIVSPPIYPANAEQGVGFRNPWSDGASPDQPGWYVTGPACFDASLNDCELTAEATRGFTGVPSAPVVPECQTVMVEPGDTPESIVAAFDGRVAWADICAVNGLQDCSAAPIGDELVIPPCEVSSAPAPTSASTPAPAPSFDPTSAPASPEPSGSAASGLDKVRFVGRWYPVGSSSASSSMQHGWGPGIFEVRFRGSTAIWASLTSEQEVYFVCRVDDGPEERKPHLDGMLMLATGLSVDGEHTVRCGRSSEASYGETTLASIGLDEGGELLPPVARGTSELRYAAIGDSITAGFAVMESAGSTVGATLANSDVFQTYERYLADAWSTSDWSVVARSGISVTPYGGEVVMKDRWPCRSFSWTGSCPAEWDFGSWHADVVTINLGTNDFVFGRPSAEEFQAAYGDLIDLVRSKYPRALIACLAPLVYSCFGSTDPKWQTAVGSIQRAVQARQDAGDDRVRFYATGSPEQPWLTCATDYVDYTHPTAEGNRKFAAKLFEVLTSDVQRFFSDKCIGEKGECMQTDPSPAPTRAPTPPPTQPPTPAPKATPSPSASVPTPAPAALPTSSPGDVSGCTKDAYAQCGGQSFAGDTCCPAGMRCEALTEWWSQCQPCTGADCSTAGATTQPSAPSPSDVSGCLKDAYAQCGGDGFAGDMCCPAGMWCNALTALWSQCYPCEHFWDVTCGEQVGLSQQPHIAEGQRVITQHSQHQTGGVGRAGLPARSFLAPKKVERTHGGLVLLDLGNELSRPKVKQINGGRRGKANVEDPRSEL
mmetsp:Transcript_118890/g.296592  ORF Transcript_118890/g.296592 Transcript_118890/m.296592 type:complete len:945 (-) Transcript_118890:417-3251(-)